MAKSQSLELDSVHLITPAPFSKDAINLTRLTSSTFELALIDNFIYVKRPNSTDEYVVPLYNVASMLLKK